MKLPSRSNARQHSFEELALPLFPALYNLASWLTHNEPDAEDLVQETYVKALRGLDSFEPGTNFKAWIFRIMRNCFLTSKTGLAATRTVSQEDITETLEQVEDSNPETILIQLEEASLAREILRQLPLPFREILILNEVEHLKYKEIALVLSLPIGTVMSRLARARAAFRQQLRQNSERPR